MDSCSSRANAEPIIDGDGPLEYGQGKKAVFETMAPTAADNLDDCAYNFANEITANTIGSSAHASQSRQMAMHMMVLSLTSNEQAQVRKALIDMDANPPEVITTSGFKQVFKEHFQIGSQQATEAFRALDADKQEGNHSSELLAAMVSSQFQSSSRQLSSASTQKARATPQRITCRG